MSTPEKPRNSMRERFREHVRDDVKSAALQQLADGGAPALSINAIAKSLGVSGPALYRYFANRDELLTALVIDAYDDLAGALAQGTNAVLAVGSVEDRIRGLATAYRAWAVAQPHRYELLFKPPLPGYDAHAEPLAAAARSLMGILLGALHGVDLPDRKATSSATGTRPRKAAEPYQHEEVLAERGAGTQQFQLAVTVWSRLHGIVSLELGGGFAAMHLDADALFENEVQVLVERTGSGRRVGDP